MLEKTCCFCAVGEADGPDEELEKLFTTVLPVCRSCLSDGAEIPFRHAIRNSAQRHAQVAVRARQKAHRDAYASTRQVHMPQEEIAQGIAPEALEVHMTHEEKETTASTSRRGRGRGRGNVARERGRQGRN